MSDTECRCAERAKVVKWQASSGLLSATCNQKTNDELSLKISSVVHGLKVSASVSRPCQSVNRLV